MSKEKREKHEYEANGPVAQQFGVHFMLGNFIPFQRIDNGATVCVRVSDARRESPSSDIVRFNGTLVRGLHDGEAIIGEYNVATQKAKLVTWFKL